MGGFDNDTDPRVFWPDYEFVTSYDMTPVPVGDESLPAFLVADSNGNYHLTSDAGHRRDQWPRRCAVPDVW